MVSDSTYIVNLPKLLPEADNQSHDIARKIAEKTRELRLLALRVDASAFASSYEQEVQRDLSHTLERLQTPEADHFFAVSAPVDSSQSAKQVWHSLSDVEFLGVIVLIGPVDRGRALSAKSDPLAVARQSRAVDATAGEVHRTPDPDRQTLHYHLNGFFTHPRARRKGLGTQLMQAAVEKVRGESAQRGSAFCCSVFVDSNNVVATRTYEKAGFAVTGEDRYLQQPRARLGESVAAERIALRMTLGES